ncbi:MAG: hypothetical protein RI907_3154 [Pseudomonadota bacterium]
MWGKLISGRWSLTLAVLVGMLLVMPSMNLGLFGDDYLHWAILTGLVRNPQVGSFHGLFNFADGVPAHVQALKDNGQLVWWASDVLKINFWRPLSELSQALDYALWPTQFWLMHLHNVLLYGLMIALMGLFLRRIDPDRTHTGLATWLFAGNMLHAFAVAWLACRNQMLSGVALGLTMLAYDSWRQHGGLGRMALALLAFVVGLFSAEASVQIFGYVLAYSLFIEHDRPLLKRALAVLPFVVIVLAWKYTHGKLGYGSFASPGYVDPTSNLQGFLTSVTLRMPALMIAQWFGVSSVMYEQLAPGVKLAYSGAGAVALLLLAGLMAKLGAFKSHLVRFYVAGAVLSLAPACAGYPFDRLTVNSDLGVSGALAIVLVSVWRQKDSLRGGLQGLAKWVMLILGVVHLVLFPVAKVAQSAMLKPLMDPGDHLMPLAMPVPQVSVNQQYLLINSPVAEGVYYAPLIRAQHGVPNPSAMYALGPNGHAMRLTRVDANTLDLWVEGGWRSTISRDLQLQPFQVGDQATMGQIGVTVLEVTPDQAPQTVRFKLPRSAEAEQWLFFLWKGMGVEAIRPPAVGQTLEIAPFDLQAAVVDWMKKH